MSYIHQALRNLAGILIYMVPAALVYHATGSIELAVAASLIAVLNLIAAYGVKQQVSLSFTALVTRAQVDDMRRDQNRGIQ